MTPTRRDAVISVVATCITSLMPRCVAAEPGGFRPTSDPFPVNPERYPKPPTAPPAGSSAPVFDIIGNHWALAEADFSGNRALLVLPAQAPTAWLPDQNSKLPAHTWQHVGADEFGYVWVASRTRCMRLDPNSRENGWLDFTKDFLREPDEITALGTAPSGAILAGLRSGKLVELDRTDETTVLRFVAPKSIDCIASDAFGRVWLQCGGRVFVRPAAPDAWQRQWEPADRLPAGNHDISGDVMERLFYMAGGQNGGSGYPSRPHVFNELFAFDPNSKAWRVVTRLDQPRFYNGTTFMDDRVWVIAGYMRDTTGKAVPLTSVEIVNPMSGVVAPGPSLPNPIHNPVAMNIGGRIYLAGHSHADKTPRPCQLLSIGAEETSWRTEVAGPESLSALAATSHEDNLYLALPGRGLARFSTTKQVWILIKYDHPSRSPQLATYENEIWLMGGREIERQQRTLIYSPRKNTWRSGPDLPRPLAWGAAATVGGRLMVVGGAGGRGYSNRTFLLRKILASAS